MAFYSRRPLLMCPRTIFPSLFRLFLCSPKKNRGRGAYCGRFQRLFIRPHVRAYISLTSRQKLMLLIKNVPLDKGVWIKVSQSHIEKFKVTQNILEKNQMLTFLHRTVQDTDMRSSETYTECYKQYMQYVH
jgi:hypothetical protein